MGRALVPEPAQGRELGQGDGGMQAGLDDAASLPACVLWEPRDVTGPGDEIQAVQVCPQRAHTTQGAGGERQGSRRL